MDDNNGNGVRGEPVDGVDINRNHATHWGFDNEGSSDDFLSETYRGAGPDSEPETKAIKKLWGMVDFVFNKNDHTAAELLLWPNGFQQYTPTPDDKLFEAYAGDDDRSAIADGHYDADGEWVITGHRFDPDIGAELYITNGDLTDDAYANGILAYTPEGSSPTSRTSRASSSRTSRPTSRPSSCATRSSCSTSPARRTTRSTRSRTSATRSRTSTWRPSRTPTATRRPCRSWPRSRSATSSCATGSTTAR